MHLDYVGKKATLPLLSFKDGSTALFKAAFKGHNGVIEELLKFSPALGLLKVEDAAVARVHIFVQRQYMSLLLSLEWLFCPSCCCDEWKCSNCCAAARGQRRPHITQ